MSRTLYLVVSEERDDDWDKRFERMIWHDDPRTSLTMCLQEWEKLGHLDEDTVLDDHRFSVHECRLSVGETILDRHTEPQVLDWGERWNFVIALNPETKHWEVQP